AAGFPCLLHPRRRRRLRSCRSIPPLPPLPKTSQARRLRGHRHRLGHRRAHHPPPRRKNLGNWRNRTRRRVLLHAAPGGGLMSFPVLKTEVQPLSVLIVEDSEEDTDLILLELKRGGYEPVWRRVDSPAAMRAALGEREWDIVLS